jgi:hypothetical protein
MKRIFILVLTLTLSTSYSIDTSFSETKPFQVGQCLNLSSAEYDASSYEGNPVDCAETHNFEIYRLAPWTNPRSPDSLTEAERRNEINGLCMPWKGNAKYLNNWGNFYPSTNQWASGMTSIICIAGVEKSESKNFDFYSWKGSVLDVS